LETYIYVFIQILQWFVVKKHGPSLILCNLGFALRIQSFCGSEAV